MAKQDISIKTPNGICKAGLFRSARPGKAGVILYMDAFGPRPALDGMAERLAGEGYSVLVPDLFYRAGAYGPFDAKTAFSDEKTKAELMGRWPARASPDRSARSAIAWAAQGR